MMHVSTIYHDISRMFVGVGIAEIYARPYFKLLNGHVGQ